MNRQRGISLLEIVIVVAIISIITAVAWPWYERYQQKVYRSDCIAGLQIAANDLERCAARTGGVYRERIAGNFVDCTITSRVLLTPTPGIFASPHGRCRITIEYDRLRDRYRLVAALIGPENANPDDIIAANAICGNLTLNHLNVRGIGDDSESTVAYCWN